MAESRILSAQNGATGFFKVEGEGTFKNAGIFKASYTKMLLAGVDDITIDLEKCELLDSTFLGTILGLGLKIKTQGGKIQIEKANSELIDLFKDVGLERF